MLTDEQLASLVSALCIREKQFAEILGEMIVLLDEKQQAYGNSFSSSGDFLKLLYPTGLAPENYTEALAMVRIFDKLKRIATNRNYHDEDPGMDIIGYATLMVREWRTQKK